MNTKRRRGFIPHAERHNHQPMYMLKSPAPQQRLRRLLLSHGLIGGNSEQRLARRSAIDKAACPPQAKPSAARGQEKELADGLLSAVGKNKPEQSGLCSGGTTFRRLHSFRRQIKSLQIQNRKNRTPCFLPRQIL